MSTVFQYLMSFNQLMSTDFIASISRVMYGVREETLCFYHIFTVYFLFIYLFFILNIFFFYLFFLLIFILKLKNRMSEKRHLAILR